MAVDEKIENETQAGKGPDNQSPTGGESDAGSLALGYLIVAAVLYGVFVLPRLPDSAAVRWGVTALLLLAGVATWLAARRWRTVQTWLGREVPQFTWLARVAGDFFVFVALVLAVLVAAVVLDEDDKVLLLKVFAVFYFSLLPAVLYLQFTSRRKQTVWREYVLNLFQLQVDDYAHLPRPPTLSRFHEPWRRAREERFGAKPIPEDISKKLEHANLYRRKFTDLFGRVPGEDEHTVVSLKSVHKLQVAITTVLVAIGWVLVVQPETVFGRSITPADFKLAGLPVIPRETLAFAFLGSYFYILQMLVRRYFQNDLKAAAYVHATMRIIIVALLVWTIDPLLADTASQAQRSAFAFVVGVFPTVGWQALRQLLVKKPLGFAVPTLRQEFPLSDLDGLNIWYESRLLEEGIEDMQNLATADLVDVMLNTRVPVDRLVDWVDQSLLHLHSSKHDRKTLRRYGIRTATDLMDAFACDAPAPDGRTFAEDLERLLNHPRDGRPSVTRSIYATLRAERNLQHVIAWKCFRTLEALTFEALTAANGTIPQPKRLRPPAKSAKRTNGGKPAAAASGNKAGTRRRRK